jgi:hypothetical protein
MPKTARVRIAREQVKRIAVLTREAEALKRELRDLIRRHRPELLAETGCGPLCAAILVGPRAAHHRDHTRPTRPTDTRLPRSQGSRRQEPYRSDALPQAPPRTPLRPSTPESSSNAPQLARDHRSGTGCDALLDVAHRLGRDSREYLAGCVRIVEEASRAVGGPDVATCADLVDPGRVTSSSAGSRRRRWRPAAAAALTRNSARRCSRVRLGVRHRRRAARVREGGRVNLHHGATLDR